LTSAGPARDRGRLAEDFARAELEALGWRCLGQRVRTPQGELDLVLEHGSVWICVEVKSGRWVGAHARHRPGDHYSRRQAERQERAARALANQLGRPLPQRWLVELCFDDRARCKAVLWTRVDSHGSGAGRKKRPGSWRGRLLQPSTRVRSPTDGARRAPP
jgi:putative endonuclease